MPKSSRSNQTFQARTTNLAPEAYELRRSNKIAHLELWLHRAVRAVQFGKVVQHSQCRQTLAILFAIFEWNQNLMLAKSSQRILALSKILFILNILNILNLSKYLIFQISKLLNALSQNPEHRLPANELQDIIKVKVNFAICLSSNIVDLFMTVHLSQNGHLNGERS